MSHLAAKTAKCDAQYNASVSKCANLRIGKEGEGVEGVEGVEGG